MEMIADIIGDKQDSSDIPSLWMNTFLFPRNSY